MHQADQQYDVGVIVGRFQTADLHAGHLKLIQHVCDAHEKVVIFLGVSPLWATINNPLDFQARKQMIQAAFPDVIINYVEDMHSDSKWSAALDRQIARIVTPAQSVLLYGSRDSFLPHYTGKHATRELESDQVYSASAERKIISAGNTKASADFRAGVIWATQVHYPTSFQTVDFIILDDAGQRALLGRKANEDKFRILGGFVDPTDPSLEHAVTRESKEETGLEVGDIRYIGSHRVNDWRYRAERDKILTALFLCKRIYGKPEPADDIEEVRWFDLSEPLPVVPEHEPLIEMMFAHLTKTAKGV